MSGGEAYVYDPAGLLDLRLNGELVAAGPVTDATELRRLVERHVRYTGSALGARLLERWADEVVHFRHVAPRANIAQIEDEHEGTLGVRAAEVEEASAG